MAIFLFWFFAALTAAGVICHVFQIWSIRSAVAGEKTTSGPACIRNLTEPLPPVSILKPLKGLDDNLFDNLESFCRLDYPEYELIFALQNRNDPAFKVAWKIKLKYPARDITIVVRRCEEGLNPKVNNLIPAYANARHEHILISDSNVSVHKDYLRRTMAGMNEPGAGLVTNLVEGTGARSLGSVFENLHLNSFIMGSVCFLDKFMRMPCVVGKSMLMKKRDIEAIGGLEAVKDVLAEDYMIGKKMAELGRKVVLSGFRVQTVNHYWGPGKFLARHTRWGKLRWKIGGARYILELVLNPVFMSAVPLLLSTLHGGPSKRTLALALSACIIKIAGDFGIGETLGSEIHPFSYLAAPLKDLLIGLAWFAPMASNTVSWRGNRYLIGRDSVLQPCPETALTYPDISLYEEVIVK